MSDQGQKKIRVMVVEDSGVIRELLCSIIARDPRLEVVASVGSAEEAIDVLHRTAPDVISMDIRLPRMNGFEATRHIMTERPTPIVVVSASVESEDLKITMNALRAGALSVIEKPVGASHEDYWKLAERLVSRLAAMSEVKVVRQRIPRAAKEPPRPLPPKERRGAGCVRAVGIAASTGGPAALAELLRGLGTGCPPVCLVQHIGAAFLDGFASWLNDICPQEVVVARDSQPFTSGHVHVAAPERHLALEGGKLRLLREAPVRGQIPSGSVLFESMARELGSRALGVVLTGMGDDGAEGLLALRRAGGYTMAEAESTAVVYGMPGAAVRAGAVCECLPLPGIAPRIRELTPAREEVS